MEATTSIAPTLGAQLKTVLTSELANMGLEGTDVIVMDSFTTNFASNDTCMIGDVIDGKHEYATMRAGRKHRNESFVQHVWFVAVRPGADSKDAKEAVYAHLERLENLLSDDPTAGLPVPTLRMVVNEFMCNTSQEASMNGWRAVIRASVFVQVRLT